MKQRSLKEAVYTSQMPKLDVKIGIFEHKLTKEIRFAVMTVNTNITSTTHNYIYDASEWKKLDDKLLEGAECIQESFHNDLLQRLNDLPNTHIKEAEK